MSILIWRSRRVREIVKKWKGGEGFNWRRNGQTVKKCKDFFFSEVAEMKSDKGNQYAEILCGQDRNKKFILDSINIPS